MLELLVELTLVGGVIASAVIHGLYFNDRYNFSLRDSDDTERIKQDLWFNTYGFELLLLSYLFLSTVIAARGHMLVSAFILVAYSAVLMQFSFTNDRIAGIELPGKTVSNENACSILYEFINDASVEKKAALQRCVSTLDSSDVSDTKLRAGGAALAVVSVLYSILIVVLSVRKIHKIGALFHVLMLAVLALATAVFIIAKGSLESSLYFNIGYRHGYRQRSLLV